MGYTDAVKNHTPKNNDEQKLLVGDSVGLLKKFEKFTAKSGVEYYSLKAEVINAIVPQAGKESNIVVGDRITKIYTPSDPKSLQKLYDDLFTANITFDKSSDEAFEASVTEAVEKALIYFRCSLYPKNEQGTKNPMKDSQGNQVYGQNVNIKSHKLLNDENTTPQVPF